LSTTALLLPALVLYTLAALMLTALAALASALILVRHIVFLSMMIPGTKKTAHLMRCSSNPLILFLVQFHKCPILGRFAKCAFRSHERTLLRPTDRILFK
jgi:hypothetical protein